MNRLSHYGRLPATKESRAYVKEKSWKFNIVEKNIFKKDEQKKRTNEINTIIFHYYMINLFHTDKLKFDLTEK